MLQSNLLNSVAKVKKLNSALLKIKLVTGVIKWVILLVIYILSQHFSRFTGLETVEKVPSEATHRFQTSPTQKWSPSTS